MTTMQMKRGLATAFTSFIVMVSGCATQQDTAIGRYGQVPSGACAIVAEIRAKPGKEDELRAATLPLVAQVRQEPNNLLYFLHEDRQTPGRFAFYEIFATQQDFEFHNETPHVQAWFVSLIELLEAS